MRRTATRILLATIALVVLAVSLPTLRLCGTILVEPTATEWVERTADWLASTSSGTELEGLADRLMKEHEKNALELPKAEFSNGGRALGVSQLPAKFRERGGIFGEPQVFLRLDASSKPAVLVVSWGHVRSGILVYRHPPAVPPRGFSVRAASARIYVLADEDWSSTAPEGTSRGERDD